MPRKTAAPRSGYRRDLQLTHQQMELFRNNQPGSVVGAPTWPELPVNARTALTRLMVQLMLEHAGKSATSPMREAAHDL